MNNGRTKKWLLTFQLARIYFELTNRCLHFQICFKDPPENIEISDRLITVEEGSSSGKVLCTAEAYPEANYQWQFSNEIVATDNVLFFDYGISRQQAGEYTCIAQNRHGSTKIVTNIDVLCKFI